MNQIAKARWALAFLAALFLFTSRPLRGQQVEWIRQFGSAGPATDFAGAVDGDGNVYVAGQTSGEFPGQISAGIGGDAFIRKYDALGTEVWTRQFGSPVSDFARGVAVDASGVYVVGHTFGALPGQVNAGERDAFVRKL